jgi:hypothetical protein
VPDCFRSRISVSSGTRCIIKHLRFPSTKPPRIQTAADNINWLCQLMGTPPPPPLGKNFISHKRKHLSSICNPENSDLQYNRGMQVWKPTRGETSRDGGRKGDSATPDDDDLRSLLLSLTAANEGQNLISFWPLPGLPALGSPPLHH